jgi:hypothetical protein
MSALVKEASISKVLAMTLIGKRGAGSGEKDAPETA